MAIFDGILSCRDGDEWTRHFSIEDRNAKTVFRPRRSYHCVPAEFGTAAIARLPEMEPFEMPPKSGGMTVAHRSATS